MYAIRSYYGYTGDDRPMLGAALDSLGGAAALLAPLAKAADPELMNRVTAAEDQTRAALAAADFDPAAAATGFGALADALTALNTRNNFV